LVHCKAGLQIQGNPSLAGIEGKPVQFLLGIMGGTSREKNGQRQSERISEGRVNHLFRTILPRRCCTEPIIPVRQRPHPVISEEI
jgi:hypothetical protein